MISHANPLEQASSTNDLNSKLEGQLVALNNSSHKPHITRRKDNMNEENEPQSILEKERTKLTKKELETVDYINELTDEIRGLLLDAVEAKEECDVLECRLEEACCSDEHFEVEGELDYALSNFEELKGKLEFELKFLDEALYGIEEYCLVSHLEKHMDICSSAEEIIYDLNWEYYPPATSNKTPSSSNEVITNV